MIFFPFLKFLTKVPVVGTEVLSPSGTDENFQLGNVYCGHEFISLQTVPAYIDVIPGKP